MRSTISNAIRYGSVTSTVMGHLHRGEGDDLRRFDEVYLIDERKSGVYLASLQCDESCHDEYGEEIEDVLTTFWVEP